MAWYPLCRDIWWADPTYRECGWEIAPTWRVHHADRWEWYHGLHRTRFTYHVNPKHTGSFARPIFVWSENWSSRVTSRVECLLVYMSESVWLLIPSFWGCLDATAVYQYVITSTRVNISHVTEFIWTMTASICMHNLLGDWFLEIVLNRILNSFFTVLSFDLWGVKLKYKYPYTLIYLKCEIEVQTSLYIDSVCTVVNQPQFSKSFHHEEVYLLCIYGWKPHLLTIHSKEGEDDLFQGTITAM